MSWKEKLKLKRDKRKEGRQETTTVCRWPKGCKKILTFDEYFNGFMCFKHQLKTKQNESRKNTL